MKLFKIGIFIFLLSFLNLVHAGYNYPYVCNFSSCYSTELKELNKADNGFFLAGTTIISVDNLSTFIDNKLQDYVYYYGNSTFTINNYYTGTGSSFNETLTLKELLDLETEFYITKRTGNNPIIEDTYLDGKDYLYTNFKIVIDQLHVGFPIGDKKNKLNEILGNVVNYDHNYLPKPIFELKNVCDDITCEKTRYKGISYNSTNPYVFITGTVKKNSDFILDTFKVSDTYNISHIYLKAGGSANFNFGFEDYLDVSSVNTKYKYTISYKYDGDIIKELFSETIKIGSDFSVTSDTITPEVLKNIIDLQVLSNTFKKVRIGVKEGIKFTKIGKITFYLSVENINTGDKFDTTAVNENSPLYVIPNDEVKNGSGIIYGFSKATNDNGYNVGSTFSVTLNLKDEYNNEHYDYIDGYDISLDSGSSSFIELSNQGSSIFSNSLVGVKSDSNSPYSIYFKFRITKAGYHDLNGFKIKIRNKKSSSSYETPTTYSYLSIIPSNLYDGAQKMKMYVKSPLISDFPISCGSGPIIIKATCTGDNFSGCKSSSNQSITFTSESDNGSSGTLSISDYAYNVQNFNYTMNHIDKTAPIISVFKGSEIMSLNSYNYKANNDDLKINFFEKTTSNCNSEIKYLVKINGVIIYDSFIGSSNFDTTLMNFLKTTGAKELYIKATDKYGNYNEKTINFNIYPDGIDLSKTTISFSENDNKYANNTDYYDYILTLKDKFNNPIYGKNLNSVNQDCYSYSGCKTITTDMGEIPSSGEDALDEYSYGTASNSSGEIFFRLKSYAPGVFTSRFKININEWNNDYTDSLINKNFYVTNISNNSFKKLFTGNLFASEDDGLTWTALPEYGTEMKYKLDVNSHSSVSGLSTALFNFKNNIRAVDLSSSETHGVSSITGLSTKSPTFTAKINTSTTATSFGNPGIQISDTTDLSTIVISYIIGGKNITSFLSTTDIGDDRTPISIQNTTGNVFIGVEIIGSLQGGGKSEFTGQEANFSDISKSDTRTIIRKNAFTQIKNMTNGQIVNGVKYVFGDITLTGEISGYETLVVKDGNVIISGDLNTLGKKFGIIVLKDSYDVNTGYSGKGNIYVKPNVSKINAIIYADGGFISSDSSGTPYINDSALRTSNLKNQLYMKGSLFTRNTIGGAILSGGDFILPGGLKLAGNDTNFDKAMIYDLNYIRRGKQNCIELSPGVCKYLKGAFVIEYDSNVQINPPKLFSNK